MDQATINTLSEKLNNARLNASEIEKISDSIEGGFNIDEAYLIQEAGIQFREENGEKVIGSKMGLTSEAKRKQMNLDSPVYGVLTDKMKLEDGSTMTLEGSIHPKIEPEVAFYFNKDLKGDNVTREEVLDACEGVCAAMEILDSRYKGFKYFSLEDVVADNSSSFKYILGEVNKDFKNLDLKNLKMEMKVNDVTAQEGVSSAISGDPVVSIIQQCELFHKHGKYIKAGTFVLAGAATTAVNLEPGMKIQLSVEGLKPVTVSVN